jgi:alpha-tubulin suppressor-like RCC1 family protein
MDFSAGRLTTRSQRQGLALIFLAVLASVSLALASAAQAAPNVAKAWGLNTSAELGDGTTTGPEECGAPEKQACSTLPVFVSGLGGVAAVTGGGTFEEDQFALALRENGTVMSWGADPGGALGNGSEGASSVPTPVCAVGATSPCSEESQQLKGVVAVSAGADHTIALLQNGTVVTWGEIAFGGLGDGTNKPSNVPVRVCAVGTPSPQEREAKGETPGCPTGPYIEGVTAISTGSRFFLAVSNGTVVAWGTNSGSGVLGNGKGSGTTFTPAPVCAVGTVGECPSGPYLTGATALSSTSTDSLALLSNGKVAAWGAGAEGQLGNGTEAASFVPVEVSSLTGVAAVAAGGELINGGNPHMLALLGTGTVKAWGNNAFGQLGVGMSTPPGPEECGSFHTPCAKTPVAVHGLSGVTGIAARGQHSLAVVKDGAIYAWGKNSSGELGDGTSEGPEQCSNGFSLIACSALPVHVATSSNARGIGAGPSFSLAFGPPPAVIAIKPKKGPVTGGTHIAIIGTDLAGVTEVKFGSTPAKQFWQVSPTDVAAEAPAVTKTGAVDVTVTTMWGTSATSTADLFKYTPVVTGVSPNTGPTAGGTNVTVTGAGFVEGANKTRFKFGTVKGTSVNCTSTTSCTVTSPPHAAGTVDVRAIANKLVSAKNPPADQFTYS